MEFWSSHGEPASDRNKAWRPLMESFADWCVEHPEGSPLPDMTDPLIYRAWAEDEGWGIFERGDGMLVIQADDEEDKFTGETRHLKAHAYVAEKASEGSIYHKRALALHGTGAEDAEDTE